MVGKPRTVLMVFHNHSDRDLVWSNRKSLKGSEFYLSEDYPSDVQADRKKLLPYLAAAKRINQGSDKPDSVYLKYQYKCAIDAKH